MKGEKTDRSHEKSLLRQERKGRKPKPREIEQVRSYFEEGWRESNVAATRNRTTDEETSIMLFWWAEHPGVTDLSQSQVLKLQNP